MEEHWKPVVGYEGLYEVSDQIKHPSLNYPYTFKILAEYTTRRN